MKNLVKTLRKKVDVQMNVQNIVRISYQSKNPQEALLVTKSLSESFIEENLRTQTRKLMSRSRSLRSNCRFISARSKNQKSMTWKIN
jgi:hypothetical protein